MSFALHNKAIQFCRYTGLHPERGEGGEGVTVLVPGHCVFWYMCSILTKGPDVAKTKIEIFVDLNRAGYDKSVKKNYRSSTNIYKVMAELRIT